MARRISIQLIALCLLWAGLAEAQPKPASILVSYSFDDNQLETGPDTFAVFQKAQGLVTLSTAHRWSGYRSVELRDVAGDGDFPELQGFFAQRTKGKLFLHFALMTTDPFEELNIALAGAKGFTLQKNGIAFWLKTREGFLYQVSDSMPKRLLLLNRFAWYVFNVSYDVDGGTYDLVIYSEGHETPVLVLQHQPNAPNQPGSEVDKFSFIGDVGTDSSNVDYFVDDVLVGVDESITQLPFVAPGRRKLFVDYWNDYQRSRHSRSGPLPAMNLADFGIGDEEAESLRREELWDLLLQLLAGRERSIPETASLGNRRILEAVTSWREGCTALIEGDAAQALARFERAHLLVPGGKIYRMNTVFSLARLGRWEQVYPRLNEIAAQWRDDMRFPIALAAIGLARQDLEEAEQWLRVPAESVETPERSGGAQTYQPEPIVAELYFFVLLWKKDLVQAERFAEKMASRCRTLGIPYSQWMERMGDAAFFAGNLRGALASYQEGFVGQDQPASLLVRLSDLYFLMGQLDKERQYRELVYGTLR